MVVHQQTHRGHLPNEVAKLINCLFEHINLSVEQVYVQWTRETNRLVRIKHVVTFCVLFILIHLLYYSNFLCYVVIGLCLIRGKFNRSIFWLPDLISYQIVCKKCFQPFLHIQISL